MNVDKRILRHAREILPTLGTYATFGGTEIVEAVLRALKVKAGPLPANVALVGAESLSPEGDFEGAKGTIEFVRRARQSGAAVFAVTSVRDGETRGLEKVPGFLVHAIITGKGLRYPVRQAPAGPEPVWLERGAISCHPHH